MAHQLQHNSMCFPRSKRQALRILRLAEKAGLLFSQGYTLNVLEGEQNWPLYDSKYDKAIQFNGVEVFAFGSPEYIEIPPSEFIARLEGKWVEPENKLESQPQPQVEVPSEITLTFNGQEYTYRHVIS